MPLSIGVTRDFLNEAPHPSQISNRILLDYSVYRPVSGGKRVLFRVLRERAQTNNQEESCPN